MRVAALLSSLFLAASGGAYTLAPDLPLPEAQDTGDTSAPGDTGPADTADTGTQDTGPGDTDAPEDTQTYGGAAKLAGEPGGCATAPVRGSAPGAALLTLCALALARRPRP